MFKAYKRCQYCDDLFSHVHDYDLSKIVNKHERNCGLNPINIADATVTVETTIEEMIIQYIDESNDIHLDRIHSVEDNGAMIFVTGTDDQVEAPLVYNHSIKLLDLMLWLFNKIECGET